MSIIDRIVHYWPADKHIRSLALAIGYVIVYDYVYKEFVNFYFSYALDSEYHTLDGFQYAYYVLITSFPFFFFKGTKTLAGAFSLFTYMLAYVPIVNAILVYPFPTMVRVSYSLMFFLCMSLFFLTDRMYLLRYLFVNKHQLLPFRYISIFTFFGMAILLLVNISQLSFVNFFADKAELYEARADKDIKLVYLMCWLRGCFLPLVVIMSFIKHDYIKLMLAVFSFILIFMLDKQKLTFVFPFVLLFLFFVIKKVGNSFTKYFHSYLMLTISFFSFVVVFYCSHAGVTFETNPILFGIVSMFIMRTICIGGMETQRYLDFFVVQDNPFTYYGHVNIVNAITGVYPYSESVGQVVAGDGGNSNATFWLMDGVAAYGLLGIFIVSIIFIIFKSIMNSVDVRCSVPILVCISLQGISLMMNVSLFTSINTSGLLVLFFVLLFIDTKDFAKF